jgi:tryptophan-rich hypothetical protein
MTKVKMNKVNPKALINSKWTKVDIVNKEKHFVITKVEFDEDQIVTHCIIEAVMTHNEYTIDWRDLKISDKWLVGWK